MLLGGERGAHVQRTWGWRRDAETGEARLRVARVAWRRREGRLGLALSEMRYRDSCRLLERFQWGSPGLGKGILGLGAGGPTGFDARPLGEQPNS